MLQTLISVFALFVTLGILVTIHEYGHFWVARRCGVKVLRFSIGFGRPLKTWIGKDGVEYVIAAIPLGGYVKMLGQDDLKVTAQENEIGSTQSLSWGSKPTWQRASIAAAGPIANFLLAIFIFWTINVFYGLNGISPVVSRLIEDSPAALAGLEEGDEILAVDGKPTIVWQHVTLQMLSRLGETGSILLTIDPANSDELKDIAIPVISWMSEETEPNPVSNLGIVQIEIPAVIGGVLAGERAEQSGLLAGDEVLTVQGLEIRGWGHWVDQIRASPELELNVVVERAGQPTTLTVIPESRLMESGLEYGSIGAFALETSLRELLPTERRREVRFGVFSAVWPAIQETWAKSVFVLDSVKKMVVGLISVKNINGPITIAQVAGETAVYGLEVYLGFLALLSISLGVLNLLPIPVLDGGQLLYCLIEGVTRRPVPERVQAWGLQLGLLMISGITMLAIYNDVNRLL
jgi:regulator of sigma E protease